MQLIHGGDTVGFIARYGTTPIDFSINVAPQGLPDTVHAAIQEVIADCNSYPDPLSRELSAAIADHERVPASMVLCGDGAADLIFRFAYAVKPKKVLLTMPTFAEYERAFRASGSGFEWYQLSAERQFEIQSDILDYIVPGVDLVVLCEPNNPTGTTTDRELLVKILDRCAQNGTVLLLDECFCDFLDQANSHSLRPELGRTEHLCILRSFSKLYAMAGLRLGYILCDIPQMVEAMRAAGQPWGVSTLAQRAGLAALSDEKYADQVRFQNRTERKWLRNELESLGMAVYGSQANYIFFHTDIPSLCEKLSLHSILIRDCSNYHGLGNGYYRIAVRTHSDNMQLIQAIREVVNG